MIEFFSEAGSIYKVPDNNKGGSGSIYKIEGLETGYKECGLMLINQITIGTEHIASPKLALNKLRGIFAFGEAWSPVSVNITAYIGTNGDKNRFIASLTKWYDSSNITKTLKPVNVSILGMGAKKVYFNSFRLVNTDPVFHSISFTLSGYAAPIPS